MYWLVKTEPKTYSFAQLQADQRTAWTGVRNFQARNSLRAMHKGDAVLVYHSGDEKQFVGLAEVAAKPGPDPTAPGEDWAAVTLRARAAFARPVTLAEVRKVKALAKLPVLVQPRLSVAPVSREEFDAVVALAVGTT